MGNHVPHRSVFCLAPHRIVADLIGISTQHPPLPEPGQLSEAGIAFIEECLTLDPHERPSASDLLEHDWLAAIVYQMASLASPPVLNRPILRRHKSQAFPSDKGSNPALSLKPLRPRSSSALHRTQSESALRLPQAFSLERRASQVFTSLLPDHSFLDPTMPSLRTSVSDLSGPKTRI